MKKAKVTIIGSGSTYTPELIEGLIERQETIQLKELALMDIDTRKLNIVGNLAKRMIDHAGLDCRFVLTEDLDEALQDADFVFVQIRVGKLQARILDEKIPLKHDLIGQETTGIGGFFKALRTIPVLMDIGKRMEKLCPNAFMINFSNPSGINAQAMLNHSSTKMLGLCNVPISMLDDPLKKLGLDQAEVDYLGLNHLSYVTAIRHDGRDYLAEAVLGNTEWLEKLGGLQGHEQEIIRLVRAIPSGYCNYFYNPRSVLEKLKNEPQSRGERCVEIEEELLTLFSDANLYKKPEQLALRGGARYSEVAVSLAEAIWTDNGTVHVVNALNNGALDFMADDDAVEVKATVGKNGAQTIVTKTDNEHVKALMRTVKVYERYAVKAALHGCRDSAILALMHNPLITDHKAAVACFDEMLEAHRQYLPQFE